MSTDNSQPRIKLIFTVIVISVTTLVGLKFVFDSYFIHETEAAQHEKLVTPEQVAKQHEIEAAAFAGAVMPIDQAMASLAKDRPAAIAPQPSEDTGALSGWARAPRPIPQRLSADAPAPAHEPVAADGDAGAAPTAGDAGAPQGAAHGAAADAGAHGAHAADAGKGH